MKRKVVVLGGGTGSSTLLRGLKEFPLDITAIVSVCDDGRSTGVLREEFSIPAVGDIRRVLVALSETEPLVMELFNYRFHTTSDLDGHTVGNLLLTASRGPWRPYRRGHADSTALRDVPYLCGQFQHWQYGESEQGKPSHSRHRS